MPASSAMLPFSLGTTQVIRFMLAADAERDSVLIDLLLSRSTARSGASACNRRSRMAAMHADGLQCAGHVMADGRCDAAQQGVAGGLFPQEGRAWGCGRSTVGHGVGAFHASSIRVEMGT